MVAITGSDTFFTNIDSAFTATKWEALIDQAIDRVNGKAKDDILPNMTGTAGSKTVNLTSGQAGYIRSIAARLYNTEYKLPGSVSLGPLSESAVDLTSALDQLVTDAALHLKEVEVSYG